MDEGSTNCTFDFIALTMAEESPGVLNCKSQKVNVSSRRLTMPLNYLTREISHTPAKTRNTTRISSEVNSWSSSVGSHLKRTALRRSARISARKKSSKSVFEEIEKKFIKLESLTPAFIYATPQPLNHAFCSNLARQIVDPYSFDPATTLKEEMEGNFKINNTRLAGHTQKKPPRPKAFESNETDEHITFEYFSPSEWVYRTPPRAPKPPAPSRLESRIQPALLVKQDNKTTVYELGGYNKQVKRQKMYHETSPLKDVSSLESWENLFFTEYRMSRYE